MDARVLRVAYADNDLSSVVETVCFNLERSINEVFLALYLDEAKTAFTILFTDSTYIVCELIGVDKTQCH